MKHRLLIVGAGGFGREVLQWATDAVADGADWQIGGFLDANPAALEGYECGNEVVASPDEYQPTQTDRLLCAIGNPSTRMNVAANLTSRGARFATLVHPTAIVGARTAVGEGSILCPRVTLTADVTVGRHVIFNTHTTIGHDVVIGDCCSLYSHCDVTGGARFDVGVLMGSHASVLPGVSVGEFARISAGSVVTRHVKPYTTVFGVPARKLLSVAVPAGPEIRNAA